MEKHSRSHLCCIIEVGSREIRAHEWPGRCMSGIKGASRRAPSSFRCVARLNR